MKIIENGIIHEVLLRTWDNNINGFAFGGTDSSADVMFDPSIFRWDADADAYIFIDGETFAEWFGWWNEQCDLYNKRDDGSWFVDGFCDDELSDEWALNREYILSEI